MTIAASELLSGGHIALNKHISNRIMETYAQVHKKYSIHHLFFALNVEITHRMSHKQTYTLRASIYLLLHGIINIIIVTIVFIIFF